MAIKFGERGENGTYPVILGLDSNTADKVKDNSLHNTHKPEVLIYPVKSKLGIKNLPTAPLVFK